MPFPDTARSSFNDWVRLGAAADRDPIVQSQTIWAAALEDQAPRSLKVDRSGRWRCDAKLAGLTADPRRLDVRGNDSEARPSARTFNLARPVWAREGHNPPRAYPTLVTQSTIAMREHTIDTSPSHRIQVPTRGCAPTPASARRLGLPSLTADFASGTDGRPERHTGSCRGNLTRRCGYRAVLVRDGCSADELKGMWRGYREARVARKVPNPRTDTLAACGQS